LAAYVGLELGDGVLLRFENGTFSLVLPLGEDRRAGVSGIAVDPEGTLWALLQITGESGAPHGIAGFDGEDWSRHLQGARISDLAIGPAGSLWAAASDGIHVVQPLAAAR
jgi:hypothetical protein